MSEPAIEHAEVPSGSGYRGFGADVNRPVLALCTAASAAPVLITLLAGVTSGAVSHIGDPVVAATAIAAAVLMAGLAFAVLHRMLVRPLQRVHRELADLTGSVQEASSGEDIPLRDELAPRGQAADDLPTLLATLHRVVETARGADARSENKCSVCDRRKAVRTMADTIQNGARVVADELADHGRAMMNHARQAAQFGSSCSKAIDDVLVLAQRGYDGSSATWDQICRLASAADGVARHVDDSREGTARVQSEVCDAQAGLSEAARFSQEIATSAARIRALAERIDLVALNAAIEAVRVGEAGKSFAVVAAEVQTLAGETAQVTDDLVEQVEALQMVTERTQTTFFGVGQTMGSLSGAVAAIAGKLQTQTGGLQAVREAMETAAAEAHQVVGRLGEMQQTSRTAQTMLDEVDDHAQVLVDAIIDLRKSLTRIVRTSVPEADLRRHPRVPVECPAVIVHDGQQHEGRLIDVSEGGAAVTTDASLPEGGRVQVAIPDAGDAIPGRIVGRDPETGTLRIAFDQAGSDPVTALLARITR